MMLQYLQKIDQLRIVLVNGSVRVSDSGKGDQLLSVIFSAIQSCQFKCIVIRYMPVSADPLTLYDSPAIEETIFFC